MINKKGVTGLEIALIIFVGGWAISMIVSTTRGSSSPVGEKQDAKKSVEVAKVAAVERR